MKKLDYKEIHFRGGLEIHQQINTRKLFCECPTTVRTETPNLTTKRKLHAVASELGEYDPAALHEVYRDRTFNYQSYNDSVCLVELDEEPPHPVNRNALEVVVQVSLALNARLIDEIQVMRKTVIDGSNTAGFQRTMLVGTEGTVQTSEGDVNLQYFCLEEDAARIIETNGSDVKFRLDRLGIPLLEIVTGPEFISPAQGGEVADKLGHIIRSLNVRRGIGSIRQDVNVSTKYGTRIEIKGVQKHKMIPVIMDNEARRQVSLYNISKELLKRREKIGVDELSANTFHINDLFTGSQSEFAASAFKDGKSITALRLPGFYGLPGKEICPGKWLGTELKDQVLTLGITDMIHSDEKLNPFGISDSELEKLKKNIDIRDKDAFLIFASKKDNVQKALGKLYTRLQACFDGVPKESRRSLKDGNTQFMRPLPGEARMYPETDIPPVIITDEYLAKVKTEMPDILEKKIERIVKQHNLSLQRLRKIEDYMEPLIYGIEVLKLSPQLVFNILGSNVIDARRKTGRDFDSSMLFILLDGIKEGKVLVEGIPDILERINAGNDLKTIIEENQKCDVDIDQEIKSLFKQQPKILLNQNRHAIYMGMLMKKLRGRIDGKIIADKLNRSLEEITS